MLSESTPETMSRGRTHLFWVTLRRVPRATAPADATTELAVTACDLCDARGFVQAFFFMGQGSVSPIQ